jgi:acetoin utilization deacetylase AcuC-like enzyme
VRAVRNDMGLVFFPAFDWAISPTHPEREERLLYTRDQIVEEGLLDIPTIREYRPYIIDDQAIERVHIPVPNVHSLITNAHRISAGGTVAAAEAVLRGEVRRAFALVRPPGHHAMRVVHGIRGFCTINIEAIMIEHVRQKYGKRRIAIIDTDVHHGDGTQDIYYHDPDVLFISFHQDGRTLYPGSGFVRELGGPNAYGATINIPLPPGTGDEGLHYVVDRLIQPILAEFKPELVINSAGQDNHYSDPLANMRITAQGYARLAEKLNADIAVLEGGYSIEQALPYVNVGIILAMAGMDYSKVKEPDYRLFRQDGDITEFIEKQTSNIWDIWQKREQVKQEQLAHWGNFYQASRQIYYDESGITEHQEEQVRLCRNCAGFMTIDSRAVDQRRRRTHVFAVIIPRFSCPDCAQEALERFWHATRSGKYQYTYLQDKPADKLSQNTIQQPKEP